MLDFLTDSSSQAAAVSVIRVVIVVGILTAGIWLVRSLLNSDDHGDYDQEEWLR